ncbi:MAG: hypothetical protein AB1Z98_12015 [Nannocystaceae bacterium]
MVQRRIGWLGLAVVAVLSSVGVGCNKDTKSAGDDAPAQDPRTPEDRRQGPPPRLEPVKLDTLGDQPGFLEGGMVFAAVRAGAAQQFLRQIPLPGEVTRDLARARREIGFDPLNDDVLARFAIPPDAVVSMTLGRPLGRQHLEAVRTATGRDDRFLRAVARVLEEQERAQLDSSVDSAPKELPASKTEIAVAVEELESPPPTSPPLVPEHSTEVIVDEGVEGGVIGTVPYDPGPPPLSPAERKDATTLIDQADAMAIQLRFHVPTTAPSKIFDQLRTWIPADDLDAGAALCRGHETEVCGLGNRAVVIARLDDEAAVLDLVLFTRSEGSERARRSAVDEALTAAPAKLPALDEMAGDASIYFHPEGIVETFELERLSSAVRVLSWSFEDPRSTADRRKREAEALRRMLEAPRLFDGLLVNAHHERDRSQLQATWPLREGQQALAEEVLAPPALRVPVPSLDALCSGSLACARSRGLPRPETLGTKLGLGIYGSARALDEAFGDADEMGALLLLTSTWPNALGTAMWHLPLSEARGAEAALVRGLIDALGRMQGLGLSLRSLDVGRRTVQAQYAAYARVPASDLSLVSTMLTMAELRLSPTTVEGVEGKVMMLRVPDDDVPAVLMTREDEDEVEDEDGKQIRHGWLTVVDAPAQLSWLLGLPTDDGAEPMIYGEIPDLWRMAAVVPELVDELAFARTWATERAFKASLHLDDGQPHLTLEVARAQPSAQ